MDSLFSSGVIVEGILGLMLLEGIVLLLLRASRRRGLTSLEVLSTLGAGAALMLALRAALIGAGWPMIAAWLLAALIAHGSDMALRWRLHRD
jgi:hypothetical protein